MALRRRWTHAEVRQVLHGISSCVAGATYNWDQGNENWGFVDMPLGGGAQVSAKIPLILVEDRYVEAIRDCAVQAGAVLLSVSSFKTNVFHVSKELLETVFGRPLTSTVNYDMLSISDLYYATVT